MGTRKVSLTVWLVWAAIAVGFVAAVFTGRALYDHDVIGAVPMGSETAVYVGPCTVQPFQLTGTCHTETRK